MNSACLRYIVRYIKWCNFIWLILKSWCILVFWFSTECTSMKDMQIIKRNIHFCFLTVDFIWSGAWYGGSADEPGSDGTSWGHDRGSALLRTEARGSGQSCYVVPQGKSKNVSSMKEVCSLINIGSEWEDCKVWCAGWKNSVKQWTSIIYKQVFFPTYSVFYKICKAIKVLSVSLKIV